MKDADLAALEVFHRDGEEVSGDEAAAFVHFAIEAGILIGLGDEEGFVGLEDVADDADGGGDADFLGAECDFGPQLAGFGIVEKDAGALRADEGSGGGADAGEEGIEVGGHGQKRGDIEHQLHLIGRDGGSFADHVPCAATGQGFIGNLPTLLYSSENGVEANEGFELVGFSVPKRHAYEYVSMAPGAEESHFGGTNIVGRRG